MNATIASPPAPRDDRALVLPEERDTSRLFTYLVAAVLLVAVASVLLAVM